MPAFIVKKVKTTEEMLRPPPRWHAWNLIPCETEGYGKYISAAWRIRMQCYEASAGVPSEYDRLLEQPYVEVVKLLLLQRAANY